MGAGNLDPEGRGMADGLFYMLWVIRLIIIIKMYLVYTQIMMLLLHQRHMKWV